MKTYEYGQRLTFELTGGSCLLSRKKNESIYYHGSFCTLHSLAGKVLRKKTTSKSHASANLNLAGEEMLSNVQIALEMTFENTVTEWQVKQYYYHLREHLNGGVNISSLPHGFELIKNYQLVQKDKLDWEESIQLAAWYLNQCIVTSIPDFNFKNIILVRPELLELYCNKNTRYFFDALCNWNTRYPHWDIYSVTETGNVFYHSNGFKNHIYTFVDGCSPAPVYFY